MVSDSKNHLAAVLHGANDLRIESVQTEQPAPDQVSIAVRATVHYHLHGRNGAFELKQPMALGHESAGEVVAVGSQVNRFKVGDKVAIEAGLPCRQCKLCRSARYNLCKQMQFASSAKVFPHKQGTLQQIFNHSVDFVHMLPESITFEEGALLEPFAVALQAVDRAQIHLGSNVIIIGAGAVGLLCAAACKAAGASRITIMDIDQARLDFATKYAANKSYKLGLKKDPNQDNLEFARATAAEILSESGPGVEQADVVMECTGVESCVQTAIQLTESGGKVVLVGMGTPVQKTPIGDASLREVDLIGVFRYANQYPKAISLVASGQVDLKSMVTQSFDLKDSIKAFETVRKGGPDVRKVMITS